MSRRHAPWTPLQRGGRDELRALHAGHPDKILAVGKPYRPSAGPSDSMFIDVTLSMAPIERPAEDQLLGDSEDVTIAIGATYPARPPKVWVNHDRFVDVVHVLYGRNLCIYLDEDREWHPDGGVADVLEQIWRLFENAANERFNPKTALFHPIGGLNPYTPGASAAVVRSFPGTPGKPLSLGRVSRRSPRRVDVGSAKAFSDASAQWTLTVTVSNRLPFGPGATLCEMLDKISRSGGPTRPSVLLALQRTITSCPSGEPVHLTLAVARGDHVDDGWQLCTGRIPVSPSAHARVSSAVTPAQVEAAIGPNTRLEWCNMSDQRPELATRRDARRPMRTFHGRAVEVWGCGALGSWIAEILVRAGVARIRLVDTSAVSADLLVRQNYVETDVGFPKATQLKARLEAISDTVEVEAIVGSAVTQQGHDSDLIIDATVNEAVAAFLTPSDAQTVVASVATDVESASLGLLVVGSSAYTPGDVQDVLSLEVRRRGDLEPFHRFWTKHDPGDMVLPTPGCSTPTFHGSAADAAGLASTMLTLLANHLNAEIPGMHLINMPHSGLPVPAHVFLEFLEMPA